MVDRATGLRFEMMKKSQVLSIVVRVFVWTYYYTTNAAYFSCCPMQFFPVSSADWSTCYQQVTLTLTGNEMYNEKVCKHACSATASCTMLATNWLESLCTLCISNTSDVTGIVGVLATVEEERLNPTGSIWMRNLDRWLGGEGCRLEDSRNNNSDGSPFSVEFHSPLASKYNIIIMLST